MTLQSILYLVNPIIDPAAVHEEREGLLSAEEAEWRGMLTVPSEDHVEMMTELFKCIEEDPDQTQKIPTFEE